MINKILWCLALGVGCGYGVYFLLGLRHKSSDGQANGALSGGKPLKKKDNEKKTKEKNEENQAYNDTNEVRHTPRSEWVGGARR